MLLPRSVPRIGCLVKDGATDDQGRERFRGWPVQVDAQRRGNLAVAALEFVTRAEALGSSAWTGSSATTPSDSSPGSCLEVPTLCVDRRKHLAVNVLPILVEVDGPSLDTISLKADINSEGFVHLWVKQNAFVLWP